MGERCKAYPYAVIGTEPQDLKFVGEKTTLEIGEETIIREFCTINRGTKAAGMTKVGKRCAFLTGVHIGHDCILGDRVIISNGSALAGHVTVGNHVTFSAMSLVHQFCQVGDYAFVGPNCLCIKDVVPFALLGGSRDGCRIAGLNKVRLDREDFSAERRSTIKQAFKVLFRSNLTIEEASETLQRDYPEDADVQSILALIRNSQRGIFRMKE
jgi:UDP-N-acetylglucosamine acyltransferase